jgi:hypothetical protein
MILGAVCARGKVLLDEYRASAGHKNKGTRKDEDNGSADTKVLANFLDAIARCIVYPPKQLFLQALSKSYVHHQKIRKRIRSSRKKSPGSLQKVGRVKIPWNRVAQLLAINMAAPPISLSGESRAAVEPPIVDFPDEPQASTLIVCAQLVKLQPPFSYNPEL